VLLAVIIAWLAVVLVVTLWAALRGWRLWKTARSAQREVERQLENAGLERLPERMAELEHRQALLAEALDRLQISLAELRVLVKALTTVGGRLSAARAFFTTK
jgi:uncharacterized membrane protein YccC